MKTYQLFFLSTLILIACNNTNTAMENNKEVDTASKNETSQSAVKDPVSPFYLSFEYDGKQELIDLEESDLKYNYSLTYENSTNKNELTTKFKINKEQVINFSLFLPGEMPQDITTLKDDTCVFNLKNIVRGFNKNGVSNNTVTLATNNINNNRPIAIIRKVDHLGPKTDVSATTNWYLLTGTFEGNIADSTGSTKKLENGRFAVVIRK